MTPILPNKWKPRKNLTSLQITIFWNICMCYTHAIRGYYQIVEHELQYFLYVIWPPPPDSSPVAPSSSLLRPFPSSSHHSQLHLFAQRFSLPSESESRQRDRRSEAAQQRWKKLKIVRVALYRFRLMNSSQKHVWKRSHKPQFRTNYCLSL